MDKIINFSHKIIMETVTQNDITLDLTAGRGYDTLFLAKISKFVYSFDIQIDAINDTKALTKKFDNIRLIHDNHEKINDYLQDNIKAAIFNLGYLPRGNKEITTNKESTIKALKIVLKLLLPKGRCVLVIYPGHPNGNEEADAIERFLKTISQKQFEVLKYQFINQINKPPYLIAIERL